MIYCIQSLLLLPLFLFICGKKKPAPKNSKEVKLSKETKNSKEVNLSKEIKPKTLNSKTTLSAKNPSKESKPPQNGIVTDKPKNKPLPKEERSPDPTDALAACVDPSKDVFPATDKSKDKKGKELGKKPSEKKEEAKKTNDTALSPKGTAEGSGHGSQREASALWFVNNPDAKSVLREEATQVQTDKTISKSEKPAKSSK